MAKPKPDQPVKWNHVATRLTDDERAQLAAYRDRHGLKSLNGAVRHWLRSLSA